MGNICGTEAVVPYYQHPIPTTFTTYRGAGMIFDNGRMILCGFEPGKRHPALYGIGGKREATDANYRETAAREVLEELFGLVAPPRAIQQRILMIPPREEVIVHGYVMLRYSFDDLMMMLLTLRDQQSPFYRTMPQTVSELVLGRGHVPQAELSHLCLLPMVTPAPKVSKDLADDILRLLTVRPGEKV
jgi:hypothetical protein